MGQIVNPTTPAQYFHVLSRQLNRDFRKPLVVVSPKGLLRLKECVSDFDDMAEGTKFQNLIPERQPESLVADDQVRRIVLCAGQIYYEIVAAREEAGVDDVAVATIEQIAPFPFDKVA